MFTKELVYIPLGPVGDFSSSDGPDMLAMKFYVSMPGPIYADRIWVQSENIRGHYIEELTRFAAGSDEHVVADGQAADVGEMRKYWENKVSVEDGLYGAVDKTSACAEGAEMAGGIDRSPRKRILFGIASYEYYEHREIFEKALRLRLQEFKDSADKVDAEILVYDVDTKDGEVDLQHVVTELASDYSIPVRGYDLEQNNSFLTARYISGFAAYYGSSIPLIHEFIANKKPVMIADYDI